MFLQNTQKLPPCGLRKGYGKKKKNQNFNYSMWPDISMVTCGKKLEFLTA
jgi:hypothetical protein